MSTLLDPRSLIFSVNFISYDISLFSVLIDSGSFDCFVDTFFVNDHGLSTYPILPLQLQLFDGTTNSTITQALDLSVHFKTGDITPTMFYITPLDGLLSSLTDIKQMALVA